MRSTEVSGTPATTRKRARNQTSAAGSLSLLAVPKLKAGDPNPPPEAQLKPHIGAHMPLLKSPKQRMKTADTAVHRGKENRPVTDTEPAQANMAKLRFCQASSNKPIAFNGNPGPKHKLPGASTVTKTAESYPTSQEASPAPATSESLSPSLQHSDNLHGPSASGRQHATEAELHSGMSDPNPFEQQQAGRSSISDSIEVDQAFLPQDVPLACHTAINKRRRPVGQATRYGEWYTGNDTDLDEQLLEYNAEPDHAVSAAGSQLGRRKSDLASYAADKDDANFTDDEAEAAHKKSSRLRRSTIAPGQDTAAQVAAMTAELNRLADDMLPKGEDPRARKGAKHKQDSQQHKDLRERLVASWDGKTYYERLQAEAEQQLEAKSSNAGVEAFQESKQSAEIQAAGGLKPQSSHPQGSSPSSKGCLRKARSGALTPKASQGKLSRAQSPSRESVIMSPELLGSSKARQKASKPGQDRVQIGSPPTPFNGRAKSPHRKEEGPTDSPGQPARKAAERQRLPPLPLSARGASQGTKSTAATRHAAQPAGNASRQQQQQHKGTRAEQAPGPLPCMPADRKVCDGTAANRNASDDKAADPGTRDCQHHQQHHQLAGKIKQAGVLPGPQHGERKGYVGSSGSKMQKRVTTLQSEQATVSGAALPVGAAQARQQPASSKGKLAPSPSTSLLAHSSPCAVSSSKTGESSKASAGSRDEPVGVCGVQQGEGGLRGSQQQVARLTASNTALLAELVDLQAARALLEEQLVQERNLRLAVEASRETLSQQLAEQQSDLATAKQQVCDLQSAVASSAATARQAGSSGALQSAAGTAILEGSLRAVKHHAAALAEAAAALESLEL